MSTTLATALSELTGTTAIGGDVTIGGSLKKTTTTDFEINGTLYTLDDGTCEKYINKTGAASVKGTLVKLSGTTANSVTTADTSSLDHIGVMYSNGVADGEEVWIVKEGDAYILLENSTASTLGYWVAPSTTVAGRVVANVSAPSGGTIAQLERHFQEVGHCRQTLTAGTNVLCLVHLHFN